MSRILPTLRKLTIGQWEAIDRDWLRPQRAASPTALAGLLVVIALSLVAHKYGAKGHVFNALFGDWLEGTEYRLLAKKLWWNWVVTLSFAVPPFLYARYVLGESMADLGMRVGDLRKHWPIYGVALGLMLPVLFIISVDPGFQQQYPMYKDAHLGWEHLLLWELSYAAQFVALELLFRGVLIVPFARRVGALSVAFAALPYCMLHFGKPLPETIASVFAGLFLATMALRSRSYLGGIAVHVGVAWSMDLLAMWRRGVGIG